MKTFLISATLSLSMMLISYSIEPRPVKYSYHRTKKSTALSCQVCYFQLNGQYYIKWGSDCTQSCINDAGPFFVEVWKSGGYPDTYTTSSYTQNIGWVPSGTNVYVTSYSSGETGYVNL